MKKQSSRSKGKEPDNSTTPPNVQTGGGGYNPQIQGEIKEVKTINMGPMGSGHMRFISRNKGTGQKDNSTTQGRSHVPNNQTGGGGYNPQIQGEYSPTTKINKSPSPRSRSRMSFDPPNGGTQLKDNIGGGEYNPQIPGPSGGKPNGRNDVQGRNDVTNIQTGRFGYNPQIQGEIIKANQIHMGPSGSGSMSFDSTNVRTITATKGQTPPEDKSIERRQGTNKQTSRKDDSYGHFQKDMNEEKIDMARKAAGQTPKDNNKTQRQGHIKNDQTGGGGYNPQIQGKIKAGEIKMGPSDSGNMSFNSLDC